MTAGTQLRHPSHDHPSRGVSLGIDAGLPKTGQNMGRKAALFEATICSLLRRVLESLKPHNFALLSCLSHAQTGARTALEPNKGRMMAPIQRVNVDLASGMLEELDRAAKEMNISRQAVIKTLIRQALDQQYLARGMRRSV
jgi:Ribbon-helix-helix protein, copG family